MTDNIILTKALREILDMERLETVVSTLVALAEAKERHFNARNTEPDDKEARQWHRAVVALDKALMAIDI